MLRTILLIVTVLFIAIAGGTWSAGYVLTAFDGFSKLQIGQWEAFPNAGTESADPYALANTGRRGDVALGQAEGLVFYLRGDDEGKPLSSQCRYRFKGSVPEARFFTLYTTDKNRETVKTTRRFPSELYSHDIIRDENARITILISSTVEPGNWLAVEDMQEYRLILTLYDTPIATATGLAKPVMPAVERIKEGYCG